MANTWIRNPQNVEDEHPWVTWFADPRRFRNVTFDPIAEVWRGKAADIDALGLVTDNG